MQVDLTPSTVHECALKSPGQWAALSERMLSLQGLPLGAAATHLEAAAAMATAALGVDTRRGVSQRHAPGVDVRRLTGSGISANSGVRNMTWLLRHLQAFAETFPQQLVIGGHSAAQPSRLAAPKQLRNLWLVRLLYLRALAKRPVHPEELTGSIMRVGPCPLSLRMAQGQHRGQAAGA